MPLHFAKNVKKRLTLDVFFIMVETERNFTKGSTEMEKEDLNNLEFKNSTRKGVNHFVKSFFYKNKKNGQNLRIDLTYNTKYSYPNGGNPYDAETQDVLSEISVYEESLARKMLGKNEKCIYHVNGEELKSDFAKEIVEKTRKDQEKASVQKSKPKSAEEKASEALIRKEWEDYLTN